MKKSIILFLLIVSYMGNISAQSINLSSYNNDAITFINSGYENGYGAKLYPKDDGFAAGTSVRFAVRANSTTYTDAMLIRVADANGKGNGNVSIGFSATDTSTVKWSRLSVLQDNYLGDGAGSYQLIATFAAKVPNVMKNNLWVRRESTGGAWQKARLHDGISVDATSYRRPGVDTRTWWERNPNDDIQSWGNAASTYMTLKSGNLGLGVTNPTRKLEVNGTIRAKEVIVETTGSWADYVFDKDYQLPSLTEVENHIKAHQHLPEIPSAAEVNANGVNLAEMNVKLLQKVEELTLYIIEQEKRISSLEAANGLK